MFRDLKEYQEIAKIYAEKVSKPENLEERRGSSVQQLAQNRANAFKPATPPQGGAGGGVGNPTNVRGSGAKPRPKPQTNKLPSTAQIRAANPNAIGGGNAGGSTDSGGTSKSTIKSVEQKPTPTPTTGGGAATPQAKPKMGSPDSKFIKKDKGVGFVKRGTPMAQRAENKEKNKMRAQEMAKKRIAAKKEGTASTPMSGKEKAQAMAKARLAAKNKPVSGGSAPQAQQKAAATPSGDKLKAGSFGISAKGKEQAEKNKTEVANKKPSGNTSSMNVSSTKKITQGTGGGTAGATSSAGSLEANKKKAAKMKEMEAKRNAMEKEFEIPESNQFDAYDLVLDYLLSSEQVATIEEANYVMTEMDAETIQGIVEEQKKNLEEGLPLLAKGAMVVGGAVLAKKGLDKAKKSFDNYIDNQRDKPGGGNTRPGADKIYFGDKKNK